MERLWAFKRINYLLTDKEDCTKGLSALIRFGNVNDCREEALKLALEYGFVTDLTSLVIEENNTYTKKGPVQVNKTPKYARTTKPFRNYRPSQSSYGTGILAGPASTAHSSGGGGSPIHATSSGSFTVQSISAAQDNCKCIPERTKRGRFRCVKPVCDQKGCNDMRKCKNTRKTSSRTKTSVPTLAPTSAPPSVPTILLTYVSTSLPSLVTTLAPNYVPISVKTAATTMATTASPTVAPTLASTSETTSAPTLPPTFLPACKMAMYDQTYFRGKSVEITENVNDFITIKFDNLIASVKIEGNCCWTLFADKCFQGASVKLKIGEYQSATNIIDVFKKASSAKNSC